MALVQAGTNISKIRIKSYHAPSESFSPYNYLLKSIPNLQQRYLEISRNIGSQSDLEIQEFGSLPLHICCDTSKEQPIDVKDVISKRAFPATKLDREADHNSLRHFLESEAKSTELVSLIILRNDCEAVKELRNLSELSENIIFIVIVDQTKSKPSDDPDFNLYYTFKDEINSDISDVLERKVLKTIKRKCENVSIWLNKKKSSESEQYEYNHQRNGKRKAFVAAKSKIREVLKPIQRKCENVSTRLNKKKTLDSEQKTLDSEQNAHKYPNTRNGKRKALVVADSNIKGISLSKRSRKTETLAGSSERLPETRYIFDDATSRCDTDTNLVIQKEVEDKAVKNCESANIQSKLGKIKVDTIESLYTEMLALYSTSKVPEQERPNVIDSGSGSVSEEVKKEIFAISNQAIKGMGYRFTTFVIYIEEIKNEAKNQTVRGRIEEILRSNGIEPFRIEVADEVKHYGYDVRVGSKIKSSINYGTLGCFAYMKKDDPKLRKNNDPTPCVLLSKHLAMVSETGTVSYIPNNTDDIEPLGKIIKETVPEDGLDIAAVELRKRVKISAKFRTEDVDETYMSKDTDTTDKGRIDKSKNETKEKESEDDTFSLKGKLCHFIADPDKDKCDILINGRRVYIWGATSNPGRGVITMHDYTSRDMKHFIQIEDRVPKEGDLPERFCDPGDSGAIVCAEDRSGEFVHLISMLIGENLKTKKEEDRKCRRKYLALPLASGLQELKNRTGHSFEVFECI